MCVVIELCGAAAFTRLRRLVLCDNPDCELRQLAERPIDVVVEQDELPGEVLSSGAVVYVPVFRSRPRVRPRKLAPSRPERQRRAGRPRKG